MAWVVLHLSLRSRRRSVGSTATSTCADCRCVTRIVWVTPVACTYRWYLGRPVAGYYKLHGLSHVARRAVHRTGLRRQDTQTKSASLTGVRTRAPFRRPPHPPVRSRQQEAPALRPGSAPRPARASPAAPSCSASRNRTATIYITNPPKGPRTTTRSPAMQRPPRGGLSLATCRPAGTAPAVPSPCCGAAPTPPASSPTRCSKFSSSTCPYRWKLSRKLPRQH